MNIFKRAIIFIVLLSVSLTSCHDIPEYADDPKGNFEALWTVFDHHYCFFKEKNVDWDEVYVRYSRKISDKMSRDELFNLLSEMVAELKDGHVNLSSPWSTSYYRKWWSDYPQNYDARLIEQYYYNFNYRSLGTVNYGLLSDNIGYMHYGSFETGLGAGNVDYILQYFSTARALIIDVRDNGGGVITHVEDLVNRFISKRTLAGYIIHKTGPGHDDFDEPYAYYFDPIGDGHIRWEKPVVVLANRSTFSAANNFVSIMKLLPGVAVIGDVTGGGSGMPYSSELPNGWGVRFSACSILDAQGNTTEQGVTPTEGCKVDMTEADAMTGHDTILDFAISYINSRF
ncbi:MAG: S41 family peptidase [Muribaculaceae bacterium]|nr:S41 family peptidase [Muribaculaceae bacterium]